MWFTLAKLTEVVNYSNLSSHTRVRLGVTRERERGGWSESTPLPNFVYYFLKFCVHKFG